jgi:hypothetical protein
LCVAEAGNAEDAKQNSLHKHVILFQWNCVWSNALTCRKLWHKGKSQTLKLLREAYGADAMKNVRVFELHDRGTRTGKS